MTELQGKRFDSGKPDPMQVLKLILTGDSVYGVNFQKFVRSELTKYPEDKSQIADNYPIDESYLEDFHLALADIAKVSYFGGEVKGYGKGNWKLGMKWSRVVASLLRHLVRFWLFKEDRDPESGLRHTSLIAWNALALATYFVEGIGEDDR